MNSSVPSPALQLEPDGAVASPGLATRLFKGSSVYAAANFATKAINFALLPVYTRFLAPKDYGVVGLAESAAAAFAVLVGLGLDSALPRFYFQYCDDSVQVKRYVGNLFRFAVGYALLLLAGALLLGPRLLSTVAPRFDVAFFPFLALAFSTAALNVIVQYPLSLYQVQEKARSFAALSLFSVGLTVAFTVVLVVVMRGGAAGMLGGKTAAAVVTAMVSIWLLRGRLGVAWSWEPVRESLPFSLPLVPHSLLALALVVADRFILQRYRSLDEIGLYTVAYAVGMVMFVFTSSSLQAFSPIFFDVARQGDTQREALGRSASGLFLFWAWIGAIGCFIAQDAMRLLGHNYWAAGPVIPWIIGGYLLHGMFSLFQFSAMQSKRTHFILIASLLACAVNIALNFWWAPRYGMYGAAYATTAAYGLEAVVMYVCAQRLFPIRYRLSQVGGGILIFTTALVLTQMRWPEAVRSWLMLGGLLLVSGIVFTLGGGSALRMVQTAMSRRQTDPTS